MTQNGKTHEATPDFGEGQLKKSPCDYAWEKFMPYEKLSKKKQRELNAARRGTWTIKKDVQRHLYRFHNAIV